MNQNQLKALAREYAESLTEDNQYAPFDTELLITIDFLRWLTKTHLIVEKRKVQEIHHACSKTIDCGWYGTESAIQRLSLLEELFDPDILNGKEVEV